MNFDRKNALELLDQNLTEFDKLEKRVRRKGISENLKEDYNELYSEAIDVVSQLFSEDESISFSQQSAVPSYELDPEESIEIYHQSILECIGLLEEYRGRLAIGQNNVRGFI